MSDDRKPGSTHPEEAPEDEKPGSPDRADEQAVPEASAADPTPDPSSATAEPADLDWELPVLAPLEVVVQHAELLPDGSLRLLRPDGTEVMSSEVSPPRTEVIPELTWSKQGEVRLPPWTSTRYTVEVVLKP